MEAGLGWSGVMDPQTRAEQQQPLVSADRLKELVELTKDRYLNECTELTEIEKEAILVQRIVDKWGHSMSLIEFLTYGIRTEDNKE